MKKRKSLEQLKLLYSQYQNMYQQANPEGKSYILTQLYKLDRQIQGLEPPKYRLYRHKQGHY